MSEQRETAGKPRRYLFDDGRIVRRLLWLFYAVCAVVLGADFFIHRHSNHPLDGVFGFYALFGFLAYALLVLLAEVLRKLVSRPRDYYDD